MRFKSRTAEQLGQLLVDRIALRDKFFQVSDGRSEVHVTPSLPSLVQVPETR